MDITKHELYVAPFIKVYAFNCMGGFEDGGVEDLDGE